MLAVFLFALGWAGGTRGALVPVGGTLLTVLVLLACPLAMYFMMRGMGHGSHGGGGRDEKPPSTSADTSDRDRPGGATEATDRALEILRERYPRGEISREEFEARRRDLVA